MTTLRIRPALLAIALNWIVFAGVFAWISSTQRMLFWWLKLDWSSWLTQLGGLARLGMVPAGSLWILWLLVSAGWTLGLVWSTFRQPTPQDPPAPHHEPVAQDLNPDLDPDLEPAPAPEPAVAATGPHWQLAPDDPVLVAHAGLREKIQRLHQSLERI